MSLPASKSDREYYSYLEDSDGKPAKRVAITDFEGDINVNSESNSVNTGGYIGKPSGLNGDFTTAYASATTITLSSLPSDVSSINNEDIISIAQFNSSGAVVKLYYRDDTTIACSGTDPTTVTVTGASFGATDSFIVMTNIERLASSTPSVNSEYKSPSDFSVAYTSSTTLTLSGLPFTISDSSQLVYIKKIPITGNAEIYVNGADGVTMTVSSNVLTISGLVTPFASGDVYEVGINAQNKAYDSSTNSDLVSSLKNVWNQYTDAETLVTAQDLTATQDNLGSVIDVTGYTKIGIFIDEDVNDSLDVDLYVLGKHTSDGTYTYEIDGISSTTLWTTGASDGNKYYEFDVGAVPYLQLQAIAGTVGIIPGDLTITIVKKY